MITDARDGLIDVDYHSFYLKCSDSDWLSDRLVGDDCRAGLEAIDGFAQVSTGCQYGPTPVRIEVHDGPPGELEPHWQHAVEVSLATVGVIDVRGLDDEPALSVTIPPGPVRVRALWTGLVADNYDNDEDDEIDYENDDFEDAEVNAEHLTFQIWSAPLDERVVLRWWPDWLPVGPVAAAGTTPAPLRDDDIAG